MEVSMTEHDRTFAMIATWQHSGFGKAAFAHQAEDSADTFH